MRETINGADLRRMIISAAAAIEINKQALNELNVFPCRMETPAPICP